MISPVGTGGFKGGPLNYHLQTKKKTFLHFVFNITMKNFSPQKNHPRSATGITV